MAPDPELRLSCTPGDQLYVCAKGKVRFLSCCLYGPYADGKRSCQVGSFKTTTYSTANSEPVTPQQCYVSKDGDSEIVHWYRCGIAHSPFLGCSSIHPCIIPQGCPRGDIGIAALSDNALNAAASTGGESNETPTKEIVPRRHGHKKKPDSNLYLKIAVPIIAGIILSIALYFFLRARKRKQEKKKKKEEQEQNEILAMEMGAPRSSGDQREDTGGAPSPEMGNLSQQESAGSSTFTRPRRAPFPPPSSPPPDRPLPPLPVREPRHAPVAAAGRRGGEERDTRPQWPLVDGVNVSPSPGSWCFRA
ncbi:hypothetical protein F4824DRAFT_497208 [Ustulina deusta]|nr:hypothetical protein F4824DRAFT_497208 [Ustulina deusta]